MRIALAYSGGLDTSVIIPWLKEHYDADVFAITVNIGQQEDFAALTKKALASGAADVWVPDCTDEFVTQYAYPILLSEARYENQYLLGTAIARPLIAKKLVQGAERFGADAVAHGATGKGNDQVRFEVGVMALNPHLTIIAPWRLWDLKGRQDEMDYAKTHNIPVDSTPSSPYSRDENLWHISHEGGIIEDPSSPIPPDVYKWTCDPKAAPDEPQHITLSFAQGVPVAINGTPYQPAALIRWLNAVGGRHGVGRVSMVENRLVGIKSRGVYETPGGTILYEAHRALAELVWDRELAAYMHDVGTRLARLTYDGLWFSPLREALVAAAIKANEHMNGDVAITLFKGQAIAESACGVSHSLYSPELATFEASQFSHQDAAGFIRLWGLSTQIYANVNRETIKS